MEQIIYRVTSLVYNIGEIIRAIDDSNNFINPQRRGLGWIENILEKKKPYDASSRRIAFLGFERLIYCGAYSQPENILNPVYYKLSVENYWKAPMILVNQLNIKGKNSDKLNSIAENIGLQKENGI